MFGVDDPKWGQAVHAVVHCASATSLDETTLKDFLAESLARYKIPKRIGFTELSLRLANGKADYKSAKALGSGN